MSSLGSYMTLTMLYVTPQVANNWPQQQQMSAGMPLMPMQPMPGMQQLQM